MSKDIVILREHSYLRNPGAALDLSMHTSKMTYANWAYAYQQICDMLGVDSGIEIRELLISEFSPEENPHRIIINGSKESNLNIERRLHDLEDQEIITKSVNPSGEDIIKSKLGQGKKIEDLESLLGLGYTSFVNNKALTYLALDQSWNETIPLLGYGHRNPSFKGLGIQSKERLVVIKPVDRSHGEGIVFVRGEDIDVIHNPQAVFGTYLVQGYAPLPQELKTLAQRMTTYVTSKGIPGNPIVKGFIKKPMPIPLPERINLHEWKALKLATDMRVMVTELDKGYGVIGHIRVAINRNGKANLSQNANNPEERAYAIGLNPNKPIIDRFDREVCKFYGVNPDKPRVPKYIAKRSSELMKIFGRPLIGFDYGPTDNGLKLFEANVTPGSAIYSYYGATKSKDLIRFVRDNSLDQKVDRLSVDQLAFSAEEIAAHRVINILCKTRAFLRTRVDKAMNSLGVDNFIYGGDYKW